MMPALAPDRSDHRGHRSIVKAALDHDVEHGFQDLIAPGRFGLSFCRHKPIVYRFGRHVADKVRTPPANRVSRTFYLTWS